MERIEEQRKLGTAEGRLGLGPKTSDVPFRWLAIYSLIALLIVGVPILVVLKRSGEAATPAKLREAGEAGLPMDETRVTSDSAREVAEAFLEALTTPERLAVTRDPEAAASQLADYPEEVRALPIEHTGLRGMRVTSASGEARFHRFAVRMKDGGMRLLCVAETARGPLVDYQAFARFGTADWEELQEGAVAEEVRIFAKASTYYQHRFEDETKWVSFELTSPDWPKSLMGYARAESVTARALSKIVGNTKQRVTLNIRPEGESHLQRQVVIEKVLADGWVRTEGDVESKWRRRFGER